MFEAQCTRGLRGGGSPTLVQKKLSKCLRLVSKMRRCSPLIQGVPAQCHPQAGGAVMVVVASCFA
jgi:hypothetical protein